MFLLACVAVSAKHHMSNKQTGKAKAYKTANDANEKCSGVRIGVIGVPFRHGQPKDGVNQGPEAMRRAGIIDRLKSIKGVTDVKDFGDVCASITPKSQTVEERQKHVAACCKEFSDKVKDVMCENRIVVNLGGDHSVAVGSIHGHCAVKGAGNVSLVWIDAHADINTPKTSQTGNMHGMPVGFLMKEVRTDSTYAGDPAGMDWCQPCLSANDIGYIGLRSVDDYERLFIDKFHIAAYDMFRVDRLGIVTVVKELLHHIDPESRKSIHVSFDIDALDPTVAGSTGTPVSGGLTLREAVTIMEEIYKTGRVGVIDLVEVNPMIGSKESVESTTDAALTVIETGCGYNRRGTKPVEDV